MSQNNIMYKINRERVIKTFTDLAEIPSPSWNEQDVIEKIIKEFKKLGGKSTKFPCGKSYNLLVTIPGQLKKKPILLSAHTDTVTPCSRIVPIVGKTKITTDGKSVLGGDNKAAIAVFIEAVQHLKENNIDHGPIEILLTCAEEQGLQGIKGFDMQNLSSKQGFVFDSDGSVGAIVLQAPYNSVLELTIKGKAAHAGMSPELGNNAIDAISKIITRLPNSGRLDDISTFNVGIITGGSATNIVAEMAYCKMELRSIEKDLLKKHESKIKETVQTLSKKLGVKATLKINLQYPGYSIKSSESIVKLVENSLEKIKIKPRYEISGGGSDTNLLNKGGIKTINLSCGMEKIHSTKEYIKIKDLINATKLTLSIIEN